MSTAEAIPGPEAAEQDPAREGCRPLRADAVRNRERILEAASQVFAERGLDATLDDIAHYAGVGVGTVYRRFPGKAELVEALFEKAVDRVVDLALEAETFTDSWEGLVWFMEGATQMQADDLGLRDVVLHGAYGQILANEARDRIVPVVHRLVARAQRDGHLRADLVTADLPIIELMLSAVSEYTADADPMLWRRYLGIVLDGMAAARSDCSKLPAAPSQEAVSEALSSRHRRC